MGTTVGSELGSSVGFLEGLRDGRNVGVLVEGALVTLTVGLEDRMRVGLRDVGIEVGLIVGELEVGCTEG